MGKDNSGFREDEGEKETGMTEREWRTQKAIQRKEREKAVRKKRRKRKVLAERAALIAGAVLLLGGGGFALYYNLPGVKIDRDISRGREYTEVAAYDDAIASYEDALKIDSGSVEAYHYMAGTYLNMDDSDSAKRTLYKGWEVTQDQGLLHYYCTVLLNEAVTLLNEGKGDMAAVSKCVEALENEPDNEDAFKPMDVLYERLMGTEGESAGASAGALFQDMDSQESCSFDLYAEVMDRLFSLYERTESPGVREEIERYAVPGTELWQMSLRHLPEYGRILKKAGELLKDGGSGEVEQLSAAVERALEVQGTFAEMFDRFSEGKFEAARDFLVSEEYLAIRDGFLNKTEEYWEGEIYIPVSRENVCLHRTDEGWKFFFPEADSDPTGSDIITVWGGRLLDGEVQRTSITYEPARGDGDRLEHIMMYYYSNVKKNGAYIPEMNYRYEKKTWSSEGVTTEVIGDWGGDYEWETTY